MTARHLALIALALAGCRSAVAEQPAAPRVVVAAEGVEVKGSDARIRIEGRFEASEAGPRFAWPAVTVHLRFVGTALDVRLVDRPFDDRIEDLDRIGVRIDGGPVTTIPLEKGTHTYRVAEHLRQQKHDVEIIKLTEAEQGTITLEAVATDGRIERAPPPRARRLLAIGDSITAGYGIDGQAGCHYDARFANAAGSWFFRAADTLGAERQVLAWSGRGLVWNYDPELDAKMPELARRAIPSEDASTFDPASFRPDAIVVNLGTNDVSRPEYDRATFARAYLELLATLRGTYGNVPIVIAYGPLISDHYPTIGINTLTRMRETLEGVVRRRERVGDTRVRLLALPSAEGREGYGCDNHPSATTHARLAGLLVNALSDAF